FLQPTASQLDGSAGNTETHTQAHSHEKHSQLGFNDFYSRKWGYDKRYDLYAYILKAEQLTEPITYLEFGVAAGKSFKWWLAHSTHPDSRFYGFDTFTGLPEDWNELEAGSMSTDGAIPDVNDDRAEFLKGLFQDTLPDFIQRMPKDKRKVLMMDADLYTSTLYVLTSLAPYLKSGDVIFFDEFSVPRHEFLAWKNFVDSYRVDFEVLGAANNYYFLALKLK
ncbi:MAG: TylF/MycF/NovP-related O-methyltransferase, partial [Bacteroidota bacterium]